MAPRPLQTQFFPARYARGGALRASALRAEGAAYVSSLTTIAARTWRYVYRGLTGALARYWGTQIPFLLVPGMISVGAEQSIREHGFGDWGIINESSTMFNLCLLLIYYSSTILIYTSSIY